MPNNSGLSLGAGIADGVSAFTQAFLQARQQKNALELSKNDRLASLLLDQIRDDNTSHYKRTALIDEYQKLYDPKAKIPLSLSLGLHKLDEQDYQVGTQKINPQVPTVNQDQTVNAVAAPENQKLDQPIIKKYGDVTPNEVKAKLQSDLEGVRNEREVAHAIKLYKAQQEILGKGGFTIKVAEGYNQAGDYEIVYKSPNSNETQKINLGKFKPDILTRAGITAGGNSGKPSVFVRDQAGFWMTQTNPQTGEKYTQQEAMALAFKDADERFESQQDLRGAQTTSTQQGNTGTKLPTIEQGIDNERARDQIRLGLQTALDNFNAQAVAASADSATKAAEVTNHWDTVVQPIKDQMNLLEKSKDTNTPEYKALGAKLSAAIRDNNHLGTLRDISVKQDAALKAHTTAAEKRLKDFDSKKPATIKTGNVSSKSTSVQMSPQDKADVAKVKANPKNTEAIKGMSDQAILDYINAHRKK